MAAIAVRRMCPPPRSLAAEANYCFMVRTRNGSNRIQGCGAMLRAQGGLASIVSSANAAPASRLRADPYTHTQPLRNGPEGHGKRLQTRGGPCPQQC